MSHKIPGRPQGSVGTDNSEHCLCIVDYHSKFPVIKQVKGLSADSLINIFKITFSEYRLP